MESKKENNNIVLCTVKSWVDIDNEIRETQKTQNLLKQEKKRISATLLELMKASNTDCYNTKDCQLLLKVKNSKKPLNKSNLLSMLSQYYPGDLDRAAELNHFLLNNRNTVSSESIVRKNIAPADPIST
jgi:Family of unknown function (DUF5760)